ncbi:YdcF family protein [Plectonema cf. radiosum LEGE 06105]|uniref:YdcF family protein n=1 Tax=Plectonema cf. radiosum LEGE 06105 TaxID=945769 RepID=A0A8J7FG12_9CYAN|nr:YdcF family protein [Plectonema radiosum]MBE9213416.1 YdcF family protein [Plectonema cf. radiosum LEGE 06105]
MKWLYPILKYGSIALFTFLLILLATIPIKLAIASYQAPKPQAILMLGGGSEREKFTAQFAQNYPTLDIWVSSGVSCKKANKIFGAAGIAKERIHLDYRAVDTVTNFTSLVKDFERLNIKHLYIITSEFHLPRAIAIATIVLGNHGITYTPVAVPSQVPKESFLHISRDVFRSIFWIITGHTGASLNPNLPSSDGRKCNN